MMGKVKPWKKIASKRVLNHKLLKVNEDTIILPSGKRTKYILDAPSRLSSVIVIAFNDKQEVLLQREYSYPPDLVMWQLTGGSMKQGETVEDAARRELAEESGYSAK